MEIKQGDTFVNSIGVTIDVLEVYAERGTALVSNGISKWIDKLSFIRYLLRNGIYSNLQSKQEKNYEVY